MMTWLYWTTRLAVVFGGLFIAHFAFVGVYGLSLAMLAMMIYFVYAIDKYRAHMDFARDMERRIKQ